MHALLKEMNTTKPLSNLFPWTLKGTQDNLQFRNLHHFTHVVGKLTQRKDDNCDISYANALSALQRKTPLIEKSEQESIRNLVRSKLQKRGLITEEIYEQFRYATDGTQVGVDVGKYAAGEPDCVITPARQYIDFFYELFVSISYAAGVENSTIMRNTAKLLATVEELERQHIFIKITLILPIQNPSEGKSFFSSIPVFSHKQPKSVGVMSSVFNDRLLRKFYFAILENFYGTALRSGYGHPVQLESCINLGNNFNEIEFFEEVKTSVGV